MISGQNPGTNHPRMLAALEIAKQNGAKILAINPLPEAGLVRFKNPQTPAGVVGGGTGLADLHLPIRINGDLALFQAIGCAAPGGRGGGRQRRLRPDHDFIERYTTGFEEWAPRDREPRLGRRSLEATGLTRDQIEEAADMFAASDATVHCWAMGITQHRNAVATIKEIVNVALPAGQHRQARRRAVPGARSLQRAGRPDDGHLGEGARPLPRRAAATSSASSRRASTASTPSTRSGPCATARRRSSSRWAATSSPRPPTPMVTEEAMRSAELTVHVSTKLNRSHVVLRPRPR